MEMFSVGGAITIGVVMGLVGAGGSILTVPLMVYILGVPPVAATGYSLFVVGISSLAGSLSYMRQGLVRFRTVLYFAPPALTGVFVARAFIVPAIPDQIAAFAGIVVTKDIALMTLFAVIMMLSSVAMIRGATSTNASLAAHKPRSRWYIIFEGLSVGVVTGIVGAGGGFLIIPALVLFAKLPMKDAIGTSLLIIAIKSLIGFTGDLGAGYVIEWPLIGAVSALVIIGIFLGVHIGRFISGERLQPAFGWFVLLMGALIFTREVIL